MQVWSAQGYENFAVDLTPYTLNLNRATSSRRLRVPQFNYDCAVNAARILKKYSL
jgi:hypothetical protein